VKEEEEDLFPAAEKALGERSEDICDQMKARFEETKDRGYRKAIGKSSAVVSSAHAPEGSSRL